MKVKEENLVIGDEYWFDEVGETKGIFVGLLEDTFWFYPTNDTKGWLGEDDGTFGFGSFEFEYEEV